MLLEVLDAKDSASLAELVETAKEVGVAAVKSFHQPKEAPSSASSTQASAKPAEPEKTPEKTTALLLSSETTWWNDIFSLEKMC